MSTESNNTITKADKLDDTAVERNLTAHLPMGMELPSYASSDLLQPKGTGFVPNVVNEDVADDQTEFVVRDFFKATNTLDERVTVPINSVTINTRANAIRTRTVLDIPIDVNMLVERLANKGTRKEVAKILQNTSYIEKVGQSLLGQNARVFLSSPMFSANVVYNRVMNASAMSTSASVVIADLLLYMLRPLGVLSETDPVKHYQVLYHDNLIPTIDDYIREASLVEVEANLDVLPMGLTREGIKAEFSTVIIDKMASKLSQFAAQLRRIGDLEDLVRDVFYLVKVRVDPAQHAASKIDSSLLENASIVELLSNATILSILPSITATSLSRSEAMIALRLPAIVATMRDAPHLKSISVDEYKQKFTVRTIKDTTNVPTGVIIARNLTGNASAQVLDGVSYDYSGMRHSIMSIPAVDELLNRAQAQVMPTSSTLNTAHLLHTELARYTNATPLGEGSSSDYSIVIQEAYLLGIGDAQSLDILAMCIRGAVTIVANEQGKFEFAYKTTVNESVYKPTSAHALNGMATLRDPAETIMLSKGYDGTFSEGDRVQVLPFDTINGRVYGSHKRIAFVDLDKPMFIRVTYGNDSYTAKRTFMQLIGRGYQTDLLLTVPLINARAFAIRIAALHYLHQKGKQAAARNTSAANQTQASIATRTAVDLQSLIRSIDSNLLTSVIEGLRDDMITHASHTQAYTILKRDTFMSQLEYHAAMLIFTKLGLLIPYSQSALALRDIFMSPYYSISVGVNA